MTTEIRTPENKRTRGKLYAQVEYYFDAQDGLYKVKQWKGVNTVANQQTDKELSVPAPGTGTPVMNQTVVIVLTILAAVAGVLMAIPGMPVVVTSIAGVVLAICAALGIASPGIRKTDAK